MDLDATWQLHLLCGLRTHCVRCGRLANCKLLLPPSEYKRGVEWTCHSNSAFVKLLWWLFWLILVACLSKQCSVSSCCCTQLSACVWPWVRLVARLCLVVVSQSDQTLLAPPPHTRPQVLTAFILILIVVIIIIIAFQLSCNGSMVFCCTTVFVFRTNRTDGHSNLI